MTGLESLGLKSLKPSKVNPSTLAKYAESFTEQKENMTLISATSEKEKMLGETQEDSQVKGTTPCIWAVTNANRDMGQFTGELMYFVKKGSSRKGKSTEQIRLSQVLRIG